MGWTGEMNERHFSCRNESGFSCLPPSRIELKTKTQKEKKIPKAWTKGKNNKNSVAVKRQQHFQHSSRVYKLGWPRHSLSCQHKLLFVNSHLHKQRPRRVHKHQQLSIIILLLGIHTRKHSAKALILNPGDQNT